VAKPDEEDGALKFKRSLLERAFREGGRASGKESCVLCLTRGAEPDLGWIEMIVAPAKGRNAVYRWGLTAKNRRS
jgi:hypothetical protein